MRYLIILFLVLSSCNSSTDKQSQLKTFEEIHNQAILIDAHNDILTKTIENGYMLDTDLKGNTHSDLQRMKQGGLDVQFFSVWSDGNQTNPYDFANRQIDSLDAVIKRNPDKIVKVANSHELKKAIIQHKIAAMSGIEGGHQIENNLQNLETFYNRGVRYMTLTWNNSTDWATSSADESTEEGTLNSEGKKGLTTFGKQVVQKMNDLGMMVDVSHTGEQTFWDVIATTRKPIIVSHSCVYNLSPHPRNLKDEQIKAIAKNRGVIQLNFFSGFIDPNFSEKESAFLERHSFEMDSLKQSGLNLHAAEDILLAKYPDESNDLRASLSMLIDHIEYIIKIVGVDYVGLGSDFDGMPLPPKQLNDVTSYPQITKALKEKGYSQKDINKILGENILRVLVANELK